MPESHVRIAIFEHDRTKRLPIPEIGDIWPRVEQIASDQAVLNNSEETFRPQQLAIARDSYLSMSSPFGSGTDNCTESYYCSQRFFYRFLGKEEYFWITAIPEQLIAGLYFPDRKLAIGLYPSTLDQNLISEFERFRATAAKPAGTGKPAQRTSALVLGFPQFMHMLWNHLPALETAVNVGLAGRLPVVTTHEPFGPTAEIFPEIAGGVARIASSAIPDLNRQHALLVGLGSRRISSSLRGRIRRVAQRHAGTSALANRERFRAAHAPIFWMTVKPPDRTALNQIEALTTIVEELKRAYPEAGFLLDGASRPWDLTTNDNYSGWFRDYVEQQVQLTGNLIDTLIGRVDPRHRTSLQSLCGLSACDEIAWGEIADFYFCHAGTPHHKIGWVHETPGMIYSNSKFIAYYQWLKPLEKHPPIYYLPANLVADDPDANYGPEKLARKDQNFTLLSPRDVAQRLLDSYREAQQLPRRASSTAGEIMGDTARGADGGRHDSVMTAPGPVRGAPSNRARAAAMYDPMRREVDADDSLLLCDGRLDPLFWPSSPLSAPSAWYGHVPFAHWIVASIRPAIIVELGTHYGASYSAFCEAVLRAGLEARCFAVDSWQGDQHSGQYGSDVFAALQRFNDARYARFSTLLRAHFDEAAERFAKGSIDLLHIDGLHTYEAVKHDFETWLPKMADAGVVLLHDTMVREKEFGVYRLWEELRAQYPSFAFTHCHGLGVVAVGKLIPPAVETLARLPVPQAQKLRDRFEQLGQLHELRAAQNMSKAAAEETAPPVPPSSGGEAAQSPGPITVLAMPEPDEPVEALADIWGHLRQLLLHIRHFNGNEEMVRQQQHGMIRDGCFLLPSPFGGDAADTCRESYYFPHRFCYRFESREEYFWITTALDMMFALGTIYFPKRRIAVILYPGTISEQELLELEKLRATGSKPAPNPVPSLGRRVVVTGYSHYMHTLWNELPALERVAAAGLGKHMKIAAVFSPFGPLPELFPEMQCDVQPYHGPSVNSESGLLVGMGSRTITRATQERVRAVAIKYTDPAVLRERGQFRARHDPVFWFSVKPPKRTCVRQPEVLAHLIVATRQAYPSAGFLLNGTSRPWDLESNPHYGSFTEWLRPATLFAEQTIQEVIAMLPHEMRSSVRAVSDVSVCEEIAWGAAANFYFCHGGTMQNKIGWIHRIPGMIHSPRQLMPVWAYQARVVEDGPPCSLVPPRLIVDCEPEDYSTFGNQRNDSDYYFTSLDDLASEFLATYRTSVGLRT